MLFAAAPPPWLVTVITGVTLVDVIVAPPPACVVDRFEPEATTVIAGVTASVLPPRLPTRAV